MMNITKLLQTISIFGEIIAYYVGALILYDFWSLVYTNEFVLGLNILRLDPYLVAVSVFIVFLGRGLTMIRTHPVTQDHILTGAFERNEVILIESLTIFGVTSWYAFLENGEYINLNNGELYLSLLGGTLSAMIEIASIFYILRWILVIAESWGDHTQSADES